MDPARQTIGAEFAYNSLVYDRLTKISPDGRKVEPMLATSWSFADSGTVLTMDLRSDVTFHDGTPFDAEAVKVNIERAKTLDGSSSAFALSVVKSVKAVDADTVELTTTASAAALPATLATGAGMMISPKALAERSDDLGLNPGDAGSGPYKVTQFKPGDRTVFERAVGYWDKGAGLAKNITLKFIADTAARLNGVRSGQLDLAQVSGLNVADARKLVEQGQIEGREVQTRVVNGLIFNTEKAPLNNSKIRQAINYAIDRDTITTNLFSGAYVPIRQPDENGFWAHFGDIEKMYPHDPAQAKKLVEESGVDNPTFSLQFASGTAYQPIAEAVQSQLKDAGITVNLQPVQQAEVGPNFISGSSAATVDSIMGGSDPDVLVNQFLLGGRNLARTPDIRSSVEKLAREGATSGLAEKDRAKAYDQMFTLLADQAVYAPVGASTHLWVYGKRVLGVDEMGGLWQGVPELATIGAS
ncbi:ABC transporter substrate-binding protein [Arthrobacter sp. W4I7]|uniref:ABC transporter substrate-binding protein n=1 Tax=Arthrobacter sp. W4I7 TaxID=3042296 RepID=UPI0027D779E2|nr:ABC transporter substrate-binding protein [Arthrobacter sp. W4I7]